jgi:cytochrome c oxidase subunit 2
MFGFSFSPLMGDAADGLWFPIEASTFASEVDSSFDMILWISLVFFVGIVIAMVWFPLKYHKPKGGKATSRVRHHNLLEISWSVLPSFLLVIMFVRGSWGYLDMREAPSGAAEVNVTAFRWGWSFDYGGGITSNELHVVVNEPTKLIMQSNDVIHSLFVPAFRIKRDIVPGRYNLVWFEATKTSKKIDDATLQKALDRSKTEFAGTFDPEVFGFTRHGYEYLDLFCTEYCGKDHSMMHSYVVVHESEEDFQEWLVEVNKKPEGMSYEEYGRLLYDQQGCKSCHSLDGTKVVGPSFANVMQPHAMESGEMIQVDENYIRESILNPMAKIVAGYPKVMPSYKGRLTDEQIQSLVAFIKSLNE